MHSPFAHTDVYTTLYVTPYNVYIFQSVQKSVQKGRKTKMNESQYINPYCCLFQSVVNVVIKAGWQYKETKSFQKRIQMLNMNCSFTGGCIQNGVYTKQWLRINGLIEKMEYWLLYKWDI